jgi:hypothetical protein
LKTAISGLKLYVHNSQNLYDFFSTKGTTSGNEGWPSKSCYSDVTTNSLTNNKTLLGGSKNPPFNEAWITPFFLENNLRDSNKSHDPSYNLEDPPVKV